MKNQSPSERVVALLNETIELLIRSESVPDSPVETVTTADERRDMKRHAERLLNGEAELCSENLYTPDQLAAILLATVGRDEGRKNVRDEFFRLADEIGAAIHEDPVGTRKALDEFFLTTLREAKAAGPGSEAERRHRQLQKIGQFAKSSNTGKRRQKPSPAPRGPRLAHDPAERIPLVPAEVLPYPPAGEAITAFPASGEDAERGRILIRFGLGKSSWIGSFESGTKPMSTIFMMPDGKHLFVSAGGAGYILEEKSRTLVERTGTAVVGVIRDPEMTLFLINHDDRVLEGFGVGGRLWETPPIGDGGFQIRGLTDDEVVGEAWDSSANAWVDFGVNVATGEVRKESGSSPIA
jgi:hypothetical protein